MKLTIRPFEHSDIDQLASYWFDASDDYLEGMGVDVNKMLKREDFINMLENLLSLPVIKRVSYGIIWELDGEPVGHSNVNPAEFGGEAYMHLHIWRPDSRRKGLGTEFVKLSVQHFFEVFKLKKLYSQPYALNPAPHRALEKAGFKFEQELVTVPGFINFEQPVKRWLMTYDDYKKLFT